MVKKIFCGMDSCFRRMLEKNNAGLRFYEHVILPFEVKLLRWHGYSIGNRALPYLESSIKKYLPLYLSPEELNDAQRCKKVENDMIKGRLVNGIHPLEYILYDFEKLDYRTRQEYINDNERWVILHKIFGEDLKKDHRDKWRFYQLTSPYFKREACKVGKDTPASDFMDFASKYSTFFVKPLEGNYGQGTYLLKCTSTEEAKNIYDKLITHGSWIVEEVIHQTEEMASWNPTSVNTVRMPSFITASGEYHLITPFLRAGRAGAIVDNAGSGGIVVGIDKSTGRLLDFCVDEEGHRYTAHPDSGIKFSGWQVPDWEDLCRLTEEVHRSMPSGHVYVAFDFAHTAQGWVLVEGNWGQLVFNQACFRRGLKKPFFEYIGYSEK